MPTKIRLKRIGRRGQPAYRVVVVEESRPRDTQVIDDLGYYNPIEDRLEVDTAQALDWLRKGAQPSDTARDLLSKLGVMAQWHKLRLGLGQGRGQGQAPQSESESESESGSQAESESDLIG